MSTNNSPPENGIASRTETGASISGPHQEPASIQNATTYWRCEACGYESICERDLDRESFHAPDCEVRSSC
jgi:hypothetical protein